MDKTSNNINIQKTTGNRLREERLARNLTQQELADKIGLTHLTISKYETNLTIPSVKIIYRLDEIGFDVLYILFNTRKNPLKLEVDQKNKILETIDSLKDILDKNTSAC